MLGLPSFVVPYHFKSWNIRELIGGFTAAFVYFEFNPGVPWKGSIKFCPSVFVVEDLYFRRPPHPQAADPGDNTTRSSSTALVHNSRT
jgi:hypothetical protein